MLDWSVISNFVIALNFSVDYISYTRSRVCLCVCMSVCICILWMHSLRFTLRDPIRNVFSCCLLSYFIKIINTTVLAHESQNKATRLYLQPSAYICI